MYTARPATSDPLTNVGPAQYSVRHSVTESSSPRPVLGHADRFATQNKIFISKKHGRNMVGDHSSVIGRNKHRKKKKKKKQEHRREQRESALKAKASLCTKHITLTRALLLLVFFCCFFPIFSLLFSLFSSPGPKYFPTNTDISNSLKQQGKPANVPAGKWCP